MVSIESRMSIWLVQCFFITSLNIAGVQIIIQFVIEPMRGGVGVRTDTRFIACQNERG